MCMGMSGNSAKKTLRSVSDIVTKITDFLFIKGLTEIVTILYNM